MSANKFTVPLTNNELKNRIFSEIQEGLSGINLVKESVSYDDTDMQEELSELRDRVDHLLSLNPPVTEEVEAKNIIYVKAGAPSDGDGTSWSKAYPDFITLKQNIDLDIYDPLIRWEV